MRAKTERSVGGLAALTAALVVACGGTGTPSVPDASSTPAAASPGPTARPAASPSASPSASANHAAPSTGTGARYPWLPTPDVGVGGALEIDSFVTALDTVPVSQAPGDEPYRFDTGDPDPRTHPLMGFGKNALLVVLHGPVLEAGVAWYLLTPAQLAVDLPTGWSPATSDAGVPYLAPSTFSCPASPIAVQALEAMLLTDGLPACYGRAEVTIVGDLVCSAERDPFVTGAPWLDGGRCTVGPPPSIYGLDANLEPGRYQVSGHFDDPAASTCRPADGDPRPEALLSAVLHCRRAFVATSVSPSSGFVPAGARVDTVPGA